MSLKEVLKKNPSFLDSFLHEKSFLARILQSWNILSEFVQPHVWRKTVQVASASAFGRSAHVNRPLALLSHHVHVPTHMTAPYSHFREPMTVKSSVFPGSFSVSSRVPPSNHSAESSARAGDSSWKRASDR